MKSKFTVAIVIFHLLSIPLLSQSLNSPANWPDTNWVISGSYTIAGLTGNPKTATNFTFDDDLAGMTSITDDVAASSPIINLTTAFNTGETWINISGTFIYTPLGNDTIKVEYYDADALNWVSLIVFSGNSTNTDYKLCTGPIAYVTPTLDISSFTATQLSGFKYRFAYDDNGGWQWGFCLSSPTIYSTTPPTCLIPSNLSYSNATTQSRHIT